VTGPSPAGGGPATAAHPARRRAVPAGLAVGVAAGVAVLAPVLGRGYALSYDMVFVPGPPITALTLGIDGSVPRAVPTDLVVALLARVLPADLVQQALLLAVFALAGWGAGRLAPGPGSGAAAAVAYTWNPYVAERLVLGHWPFLLGYAVLPWVAGAALAVRRGRSGLPPLLLWLTAAAVAGSTSGLIATGVAAAVLGLRPAPRRLLAVLGFALAVNAPWWLPAVARPGAIAADRAGVTAFAARADTPLGLLGSLGTLGGAWNPAVWPAERGYLALALAALAAVVAALALGLRPLLTRAARTPERVAAPGAATVPPGPARAGGRRAAPAPAPAPGAGGLVGAGVGGLLLAAAGALPGVRDVLAALVAHLPGGGLLRDGQKFLAPAALVVALAAGHAVARLGARRRTLPYAVLLGVLPVLVLPSLAGGVSGRLAAVRYPQSWTDLRTEVAAAPAGDVAVLPWRLYRRFAWNGDRVLLDPLPRLLPRAVRGENPRAAGITAGLDRGGDLVGLLRAGGIRYAVVHRTQPGAAAAEAALAGLPVRYRSADLLLVDLPEPVGPAPRPRPILGVGLGIATAAGIGAFCRTLASNRRRRLLGSPGTDSEAFEG